MTASPTLGPVPRWMLTPGSKLDKMNSKEAAAYLARQAAQGWPGSAGIHSGWGWRKAPEPKNP